MIKKTDSILWLDFEFNNLSEENVNLVSCVTFDGRKTRKFWLHNNEEAKQELRAHLKDHETIGGYMCVAEARSFYSLNLDPLNWQWVDLFLEYRMLSNNNDRLMYGPQLVDGKIKHTRKPPPKWERTEEDAKTSFRQTHSLAEATFKLTGEIRDTAEKDRCRELIISAPRKFSVEDRKKILIYNAADVEFLPQIWKKLREEFARLSEGPEKADDFWKQYWENVLWRGRYAAHTAIMESMGYPIDLEKTRNFSSQIPSILQHCQRDINAQFPKTRPFKWKRKTNNYSWDQIITRQWITNKGLAPQWMETDTGKLSLSLEAFEKKFSFRHDYPRGNFGAQMVRYLKLKQSLYGFSEGGKGRKSFWDSVGSDGRVRPYMNIYGAQSGRSQPGSTGFMFLKPAWMRALVQPKPGYSMAGIDYGQQEFFIGALLSGDQNMVAAYLSGDPYLFMAKQAGTIPENGTKKTHAAERELMKSSTLGILFNMTKYGLSAKLTGDTGRTYTEDEAQEIIDLFENLFPDFTAYRREVVQDYHRGDAINIGDGWIMWTDNENDRSVANVPIQGLGSVVMRKAVDLAVGKGVRVVFTLHDAIYLEAKDVDLPMAIKDLHGSMRQAFYETFKDTIFFQEASRIKLDVKAWGDQFEEEDKLDISGVGEVHATHLHIDPRAKVDYDKFSRYFDAPESSLL